MAARPRANPRYPKPRPSPRRRPRPEQGTRSSKKKKQAKLKRVMATVKKAARKEAATTSESFAAVHLLHDPQAWAERLFARLQAGGGAAGVGRYETRLAVVGVTSR